MLQAKLIVSDFKLKHCQWPDCHNPLACLGLHHTEDMRCSSKGEIGGLNLIRHQLSPVTSALPNFG